MASLAAVLRAARPTCRTDADRLAFAVHAYMLADGYQLTAAGAAADGDGASECDMGTAPPAACRRWRAAYPREHIAVHQPDALLLALNTQPFSLPQNPQRRSTPPRPKSAPTAGTRWTACTRFATPTRRVSERVCGKADGDR